MDEPNQPPPPHFPPPEPTADVPVLRPADDVPPPEPPADVPTLQPAGPPALPVVKAPAHTGFWVALAVGGALYAVLLASGGEARRIALGGLESLPMFLLALLAYGGERNEGVRLASLVYWLVLVICAGLAMVAVTTLAAVDFNGLEAFKHTAPAQRRLSQVFQPGGGAHIAGVVLACLLAGGVGVLCYLPGVRQAAARWLPLDPDSFVHATALATVAALTLMLFAPLAVLGEPPLLLMLRHFAENPELKEKMQDLSDPGALRDQVYAFAWLVPVGLLSVGYPLHRTLPGALRRVGLVKPRAWQVIFGLLFAGALVVVMQFGVDRLIGHLWQQQGWAVTDEKEFEQLLKFAINPLGAAVIGVTAGVGEELFARGVLQPRLGILLSNLFFTALHAPQYNWDALASVFVIGLVLGVVRKWTNTTTSAIVHGTYDFVLVLLSYYAANG